MDYYAGIDVSLEASSVCVVDAAGKIVREAKVASEPEALIRLCVSKTSFMLMGSENRRPVHGFRTAPIFNPKPTVHALQKHDRLTRYGHGLATSNLTQSSADCITTMSGFSFGLQTGSFCSSSRIDDQCCPWPSLPPPPG